MLPSVLFWNFDSRLLILSTMQESRRQWVLLNHPPSKPFCWCRSITTISTYTALCCPIFVQRTMPSRQSSFYHPARHLTWTRLLCLHKISAASQIKGKGATWPTVPSPSCHSSNRTYVCGAMSVPGGTLLSVTPNMCQTCWGMLPSFSNMQPITRAVD